MAQRFVHMMTVSGATMVSRVLGLLRDILTAAFLGVSPATNAFLFAFAVPNLFRRLLGEGALTSAFIPVFTGELTTQTDRKAAFTLLNQVLSWSALVLMGLVILGVAGFAFLYVGQTAESGDALPPMQAQWLQGGLLGMLLLPYLLMVCLAALMGAALNALDQFAVHALSSVWLNLAMIAALILGGSVVLLEPEALVMLLSMGVLLGGFVQLAVPSWCLYRAGWQPSIDFHRSAPLRELYALFLPGLLGAAVIQANILVSRLVAFVLNTEAVTTLYLANRLVELPLGIFVLAVTTVAFPEMSRLSASGAAAALASVRQKALRLVLALTLPAMVGLVVLREPILSLLFGWGRFGDGDVKLTAQLLAVFALALPFYASATLDTRAFHAGRDTRTPVRIAVHTFALNLVLTLGLAWFFSTVGLAWANTLAAIYQAAALRLAYNKAHPIPKNVSPERTLAKCLLSAVVMGLVCGSGESLLQAWAIPELIRVPLLITTGILVYVGVLVGLRFEGMAEIQKLVRLRTKP